MTKVICSMNCKHRSKKPLRTYKYKSGDRCYGCTLDAISMSMIDDPDGIAEATIGEENMAHCKNYEPVED